MLDAGRTTPAEPRLPAAPPPGLASATFLAGLGGLAASVLREALRPPFSWVGDAVRELATAIRRCLLPLVISHAVYLIGYAIILLGAILENLGVPDRQAGSILTIWDREIGTWVTAMIFGGVVGSAMTADLGARKIREELDALDVLGVRRIKTLVVPRVLAVTIASPILVTLAVGLVVLVNLVLGPATLGYSTGVYRDNLAQNVLAVDLWLPMLLKNTLIGFYVGVVSCYMGLTCGPGAQGVGRAVNQTVVLAFFGIWLVNSVFNLAYFSLFPDVVTLRG